MLGLFFSYLVISVSFAQLDVSDEVLDQVRPANFTMYELTPVEMAQFLLDEDRLALVEKVRSSVVELRSTPAGSASGVIVGYNGKNQPIILTAGHLIGYEQRELRQVREVSLDRPRGLSGGTILDERAHVVLPSGKQWDLNLSKGWYGLPLFHPTYPVNESLILIDPIMNFGYYVMTGRTVAFDLHEANLAKRYTVRESLMEGFNEKHGSAVRTGSVQAESEVLVMGRTHHLTYEDKGPSFEPVREVKYRMSYSFGDVLSLSETMEVSKKYALDLNYKKQFFVRGEVDRGMAGAGVFNSKGELVGVVTKVIRENGGVRSTHLVDLMDRTRINIIGAVVLRIEHILEQTELLSSQPDLLEAVKEARAIYKIGSCHRVFSK